MPLRPLVSILSLQRSYRELAYTIMWVCLLMLLIRARCNLHLDNTWITLSVYNNVFVARCVQDVM